MQYLPTYVALVHVLQDQLQKLTGSEICFYSMLWLLSKSHICLIGKHSVSILHKRLFFCKVFVVLPSNIYINQN